MRQTLQLLIAGSCAWFSGSFVWAQQGQMSPVQEVLNAVDELWMQPPADLKPLGEEWCKRTAELAARLSAIDRSSLSSLEQDDFDVAQAWFEECAGSCEYTPMQWPIGPFWGIHRYVSNIGRSFRVTTINDAAAYLEQLARTSESINEVIAELRQRVKEQIVPPRCIVESVPTEIDALLAGKLDELQYPFAMSWERLGPGERDELWRRFHVVELPRLRRSLEILNEYLRTEYVPACRDSISVVVLPKGMAFYLHSLKRWGETELSPEAVHSMGVNEVNRIWKELMGAIRATPLYVQHPQLSELDDQQLFQEFRSIVRKDKSTIFADAESVIREYQRIAKLVDHWLPEFFLRLPQLPFGVMENSDLGREGGAIAYRMGGIERAMASVVRVNVSDLADHAKFVLFPMMLHEGSPGHHLQLALANENSQLRPFRRTVWFTAYGEGWAMYAERLGFEMGFYHDPMNRVGFLLSEMHRSCRLVLDPAIHWMDWSREQAIQYLRDRTFLSETAIADDVNRYIAWPAQATAYKLGELKISELRESAERELGAKFDIREFHDVVLSAGAVPLNVLERRVNAWIASQ